MLKNIYMYYVLSVFVCYVFVLYLVGIVVWQIYIIGVFKQVVEKLVRENVIIIVIEWFYFFNVYEIRKYVE